MTKESNTTPTTAKSSLDRMADLTRRVVAVKKSGLPKTKPKPKRP